MRTWFKRCAALCNSSRSRKLRVLPSLGLTLILGGCAQMMDSTAASPDLLLTVPCQVFRPIGWSQSDSDATLRGIKAHNAVWQRLCRAEGRKD